jgi:hypothetical protein
LRTLRIRRGRRARTTSSSGCSRFHFPSRNRRCSLARRPSSLSTGRGASRPSHTAEIQKIARALPAPPAADGVRVALLLPSGHRVARGFARWQSAEDVDMWCAAADTMLRDFIRPGEFVILAGGGSELDPVEVDRILLNVRVLPIDG